MKKLWILILLVMFVASCNSENNSSSNAQAQDINKTITISAPPQINSFVIGDFVGLVVQNNSDDQIAFAPEEDGLRIQIMSADYER